MKPIVTKTKESNASTGVFEKECLWHFERDNFRQGRQHTNYNQDVPVSKLNQLLVHSQNTSNFPPHWWLFHALYKEM